MMGMMGRAGGGGGFLGKWPKIAEKTARKYVATEGHIVQVDRERNFRCVF